MKFGFVRAEKANYPVTVLCVVLKVSRSGYYAWCRREPSRRDREDEALRVQVRAKFHEHQKRLGSPRVHACLVQSGVKVGRHRIARLMRQEGLQARPRRRYRVTTDSAHGRPVAPNLVARQFSAEKPNRLWFGDITYLPTREGMLYLAVFLDACSRLVVGWSIGTTLHDTLVLQAFQQATVLRRPPSGLVVHTDQGVQYTSYAFQSALTRCGAVSSMSRRGNCWDNAPAESFFSTVEWELFSSMSLQTETHTRDLVAAYIEYYNRRRPHSTVGNRTPAEHDLSRSVS